MVSQKEDNANYFGTLFFMVLFFLLFSSFSDKSANQISFSSQYQLKYEFNISQAKAVVPDVIQVPSVQNSCLYLLYCSNFNLFSERCKILADNSKINQRILFLKKNELLTKPVRLFRWCCFHLHPSGTEKPAILS